MAQSDNGTKAVLPVFIKAEQVPEGSSVFNLCEATEKVTGPATIDGATLISGLWRVYPLTEQARIKILNTPVQLQNVKLRFESFNPFIRRYGGQEVEGTRLIISNLPFSYSMKAVENNLRASGYRLRSQIQFEKARGPDRMLSDWKTGRRYVWVDVPSKTMPKSIKMGDFMAYIYYKEMKKTQECYRCLKVGHRASECQNEEVCLSCRKPGHRRGDPICGLEPASEGEFSGEETDDDKSVEDNDKDENKEHGKNRDEKQGSDTDSGEEEEDKEVSENDESEERRDDIPSSEVGSEKEDGELDEDDIVVSGKKVSDEFRGERKSEAAGTDTRVSEDEEKILDDESTEGNSKGRELVTKLNITNKGNTPNKEAKPKKKGKQGTKDKHIDTPKSGLNQASLVDFGIGAKRNIHQAPSPDEATGSPKKKDSKKK